MDGPRFEPDSEKIRAILEHRERMGEDFPTYSIFIVSYRAMELLIQVLERIPEEIYDIVEEVFIFDDYSPDLTYETCRSFLDERQLEKVSLYRNPRNYGYGGNQKLGYEYAIAKGYDHVILLHGDGQYAPEYLPNLILPTLEERAEVVFGSRMMRQGGALAGGMPFYKFVGNKVLTGFQNLVLRMGLTEYHSGYRLYATSFLRRARFKLNTDDFHFDTQIILQAMAAGALIMEVEIPTYYGDEICRVNGIDYAARVAFSVVDYRLHQLGITRKERYVPVQDCDYQLKDFPGSSHQMLIDAVEPGSRVLDLGCGKGYLAERLIERGCEVTGVDALPPEQVSPQLEEYVQHDLNRAEELGFDREFDCVILGDIVEHLAEPERLLASTRRFLKEGGILLTSLPNIALWLYRLSLLAGRFEYEDRGIMDRTHLRFFTLVTSRDLLWSAGFRILDERYVPIPFHLVITMPKARFLADALTWVYSLLCRLWPRMFAYQFVFTAQILRLEWDELKSLPIHVEAPHPHLEA